MSFQHERGRHCYDDDARAWSDCVKPVVGAGRRAGGPPRRGGRFAAPPTLLRVKLGMLPSDERFGRAAESADAVARAGDCALTE
jgi:hypothetical protein